jgi:general stress protein 26
MKLNEIEGMQERFKESRLIFLTTYDDKGKAIRRPMTNYNESPYETIWFPTFRETNKSKHILQNPKALITFASGTPGVFFEIEGDAEVITDLSIVNEKWKWWYLTWLPDSEHRLLSDGPHTYRALIYVHPKSARKKLEDEY